MGPDSSSYFQDVGSDTLQISDSLLIWLKDLENRAQSKLEYQQAWYLYPLEN